MNSYDDLQRFKEKTQTLDLAFKDMSGQAQKVERNQWALIRQLEAGEQHETKSGVGERLDTPQPSRESLFNTSAPAQPDLPSQAPMLNSLAAHLAPAAAVSNLAVNAAPGTAAQPQAPVPSAGPISQENAAPEPAAQPQAPVPSAEAIPQKKTAPEPARFASLFRMRTSEPVNVSKETQLKPLLEKIALCR